MDKYMIYEFMEFIIFILYMILIFFSVQLRLIWNDIDKNMLKTSIFKNESFLKENIMIVIAAGAFFMVPGVFEPGSQNANLYFDLIELIGFACIVLFVHKWHSFLKSYACKKPAHETLLEACMSHQAKTISIPFWIPLRINKLFFTIIFGTIGLIIFFIVPFPILYFNLMIGLLFIPPIIVIGSMLICASTMSRKRTSRS